MKKVNIANYVIYDLANRINSRQDADIDREIADFVAENWCKKHFVSVPSNVKYHHSNKIHQNFII